jgi:1-deoxy-D-xylulose-5-phosphate synthase
VHDHCKLLVVLNDNDMSISPPVGALNRYLAQLMSGRFYASARHVGKQVLRVAPPLLELAKRLESHAKGMVVPATLFENFGFNYIGPIDGHDIESLVPTLENIKHLMDTKGGPQFLHVVTKKGQGYKLAEADPIAYHGPGKFDPAMGLQKSTAPAKQTFTQVFGQWLCDMAAQDSRLVGITPAMREGSGMVEFHKRFPERYHDVGIAEQHAVTFAAGMACEGLKPVVAIYSTFLQRGYDQLIHDVALQNLPVVFALDRAGLVGADGATHAGAYDIPFLRCIPNMSVACPADERECRKLLSSAFEQNHPVAVRYPRGAGAGVEPEAGLEALPFGKGEIRREGAGSPSWLSARCCTRPCKPPKNSAPPWSTCAGPNRSTPNCCSRSRPAMKHSSPSKRAPSWAAPAAPSAKPCKPQASTKPVLHLGLKDEFIEHGDPAKLLALQGLDAAGIEASVSCAFRRVARAPASPTLKSGAKVRRLSTDSAALFLNPAGAAEPALPGRRRSTPCKGKSATRSESVGAPVRRGTGFAGPQAGGPLGGQRVTRSARPWGPHLQLAVSSSRVYPPGPHPPHF